MQELLGHPGAHVLLMAGFSKAQAIQELAGHTDIRVTPVMNAS
jgi:site-specific recombinase XerD